MEKVDVEPIGAGSSEAVLDEFVSDQWNTIAALAWKAFTEEGRGAVLLLVKKTHTEIHYVNAATPWTDQAMKNALDELGFDRGEAYQHITQYDPEKEVVVLNRRSDKETGAPFSGENTIVKTYALLPEPKDAKSSAVR